MGRDVYSPGPLAFPIRDKEQEGPFIFQAKFVREANAAGAKPDKRILKAVVDEVTRINKHIENGKWEHPAHYVLITNAPLNGSIRKSISEKLQQALKKSVVHTLGGIDVCQMIDLFPVLKRSIPELLSLRDFDVILKNIVNSSINKRSKMAIEAARRISPVFVHTNAYHRAWEILKNHNFVVLEGPPEMGKTAIARMISFINMTDGWQVIECRGPDDFIKALDDDVKQVFIADDAFGLTEYNVTRLQEWEKDLPAIISKLNPQRWLIWTSRKVVLLRALREMELKVPAENFPKPGELIVDASDLTIEEKARMLYKHSRAADLSKKFLSVIRKNATEIVNNKHFTPERIRRLVKSVLPGLALNESSEKLNIKMISIEVMNAIKNPTDGMRKSFKKLPESHRWVLIALLECNEPTLPNYLMDIYSKLHDSISEELFSEMLEELVGTFVKIEFLTYEKESEAIDWIHPSYRDVVIDELTIDYKLQIKFLEKTSVKGIELALSEAGGTKGKRIMPLMSSNESWPIVHRRCLEIISSGDESRIKKVFIILNSAIRSEKIDSKTKKKLLNIFYAGCNQAVNLWNQTRAAISPETLWMIVRAATLLKKQIVLPDIDSSFQAASENFQKDIEKYWGIDSSSLDEYMSMIDLINEHYPKLFGQPEFQSQLSEKFGKITERLEEVADWNADDPQMYNDEVESLESLVTVIERAKTFNEYTDDLVEDIASRMNDQINYYQEHSIEPDYEDVFDEYHAIERSNIDFFDIDDFFSDLK